MFSLKDYSYHLPKELIAQEATHPHHNAKLMVVDRDSGMLIDEDIFWNLDNYLDENHVLCFNDSKVLRSRIPLQEISYTKSDGESGILREGEIFFLQETGTNTFEALIRPGDKFKIGTRYFLGNATLTVIERTHTGRILRVEGDTIFHLMETFGNLPLPPYIAYDKEKESDYQTSFAKKDGSVAAPTASLHFTKELLDKFQNTKLYTTLHVGLGTFKGIDTDDVREYKIHEERAEVSLELFSQIASQKLQGKRIIAVGTTVCRTLESLPYVWKMVSKELRKKLEPTTIEYWTNLTKILEEKNWIHHPVLHEESGSIHFSTSIYIVPGHQFHIVDDIITNFHLPESSLLVLVSAFIGNKATKEIYQEAIKKGYRFYSFGDGMYIRGKSS